MSENGIDPICWRAGITTGYDGRAVPEGTKRALLAALGINPEAPDFGSVPDFSADPASAGSCPVPQRPAWGLFCQLYELRSARGWGIGDFADLARLARIAAAAGADFLGVNPLHALFAAEPERYSPFTPSNRRFLNVLYIAMDDLPGKARAPAGLKKLRAADLVDYPRVAAAKLEALAAVFAASPFDAGRWAQADFNDFCTEKGQMLYRHALFEALSEAMVAQGHGARWTSWPAAWQAVESPEVAAFAAQAQAQAQAQDRVRFHLWLQWLAARQLAAAQMAAQAAGMGIGLYLDLAVGEAPDGSATWSDPGLTLHGLEVGAPPDVFSQGGQNWALAAPSPVALAERGWEPFRALIGAQLDYAGALRIDHAMALRQLFLIPKDHPAAEGTHLAYPFADLLRIVAEEARARGAVMIGEDLGWVPPGFRALLGQAGILTMRILYFAQEWGMFDRASAWPELALACLSTHDLPTLAAWWKADDIAARQRYGLISDAKAAADLARRADERVALVNALIDGGHLPPGAEDAAAPVLSNAVLLATHGFLAATRSRLVGVRLADLVGPEAATNVPGTIDAHPNWQRRAPLDLAEIASHPAFLAVSAAMRAARPCDQGGLSGEERVRFG
ncbi:4-alpha-glucanotransferase [Rhodobacter ferrooxidans]|uniref:4-alpha-glucanotransferase n=1 Tax=Rhodobacter ferrooxidans TaxID=371731 RepID=C8S548_9RHOB|nr:4-alpha-glucanotransferase [Rhodobacter sp. SW2]EEW23913.1 4-alpha-glucanotransferase [Rhodobacter sp. SW2]